MRKTDAFRILAFVLIWGGVAQAQTQETPPAPASNQEALQRQIDELRGIVVQLSTRINTLEGQLKEKGATGSSSAAPEIAAEQPVIQTGGTETGRGPQFVSANERNTLDWWQGTTLNLTVDGYYGYNFNQPVGRVNLLRAYDVSSNSFSLNQATVILERACRPVGRQEIRSAA